MCCVRLCFIKHSNENSYVWVETYTVLEDIMFNNTLWIFRGTLL